MQKSPDHLTRETALEISDLLEEPRWLAESRIKALSHYQTMPAEKSSAYAKYSDISDIEFNTVDPFSTLRLKPRISPQLNDALQSLQDNPTVVHLDSKPIFAVVPEQLEEKGLIFTDLVTALRDHPTLVKDRLSHRAIPPNDDKFAALSTAFLTGGVFLYVPENLTVTAPLRSLQLAMAEGGAVFLNTIVVAERESKVTLLEENHNVADGTGSEQSLIGTMIEIYVSDGAEVNYSSVQNFAEDANVFANRRAIVEKDGKISWALASLGGRFYRSRLDSHLVGRGAAADEVEVSFGHGQQRLDQVSDLIHKAPDTQGTILTEGVLKDKARALFRGMIRVTRQARNANGYLAQHAMLVSKESRADALPGLEIETNDVKATHSASVSQIDEERVFYLMSRGLTEDQARRMIIIGFFEPALQRIPLLEVGEDVRDLVESKWTGKKLMTILRRKKFTAPSEEGRRPQPKDLFEVYK